MVGSFKEQDCAVSAVIGVMLLLTIVIIMGTLVAAFAGGMVDRKETVPSVDLAVYTANRGDDHCIVFEHRGGDQIRTRDIRVNTWVHHPDGEMIAASHEGEHLFPGTDLLRSGDSVNTGDKANTAGFLNLNDINDLTYCTSYSSVVDVMIYHLPSGGLIHKSSFVLRER